MPSGNTFGLHVVSISLAMTTIFPRTRRIFPQNKLGTALVASLMTSGFLILSSCTAAPEASDPSPATETTTAPAEETLAQADTSDVEAGVWAAGSFEGRSDHIVTGSVEVVEQDGSYIIQLGEDFSLDNAPDPKVGLGSDGYDPATKSGDLIALTGASDYAVPAGIDVSAYNEVYIWCEKFDVPLGVAQLQTQ